MTRCSGLYYCYCCFQEFNLVEVALVGLKVAAIATIVVTNYLWYYY